MRIPATLTIQSALHECTSIAVNCSSVIWKRLNAASSSPSTTTFCPKHRRAFISESLFFVFTAQATYTPAHRSVACASLSYMRVSGAASRSRQNIAPSSRLHSRVNNVSNIDRAVLVLPSRRKQGGRDCVAEEHPWRRPHRRRELQPRGLKTLSRPRRLCTHLSIDSREVEQIEWRGVSSPLRAARSNRQPCVNRARLGVLRFQMVDLRREVFEPQVDECTL
ncbi:hypothetical protein B0H14DRAFT_830172 [Mycena olivaceomarginata]|nr:hypothetical protein B0H14DRAFT_830172 [Mycena olivaceomarginata]